MKNKVCVCCKQLKDINEFHKNKSKKDGIQDTCKICRKLKSFENNEKLKIYRHEWYQKNKENVIKKVNLKYHNNKNHLCRLRYMNHNRNR
jgi:hypothetical protein